MHLVRMHLFRMHLFRMHLFRIHLMRMHLVRMHLVSMHLFRMLLFRIHLIRMHLIRIHLFKMHLFKMHLFRMHLIRNKFKWLSVQRRVRLIHILAQWYLLKNEQSIVVKALRHNCASDFYREITRGDDSSLPVCSVSCTVHLKLFTNINILWVRPEITYNKQ